MNKAGKFFELFTDRIWTVDTSACPKAYAALVKHIKVIRITIDTFTQNRMGFQCVALSYFVTLAIIPLITFIFAITGDLGLSEKISELLHRFFANNPEYIDVLMNKANELLENTPGAWMPDQFNNPANARAHYETTGPELWEDTEGNVDVLVAAVGSGGTITGTGRYLKERNPAVRVVAVEPAESPVLSGGRPGPHKIQGIGAGFVPGTLELSVVDEIMTVTGDEAYAAARELARSEGVLAGVSSGAAAHAARALSRRPDMAGKTIAVILPDTGERYLSAGLFG